jgi:hypothetical protein
MKSYRLALIGLAVAGSVSCGGGSSTSTAPTPTATPFTFTITDRDTRLAVAGASVVVAGIAGAVVTDAGGQAVFASGVTRPATVAVTASRYRLRNADVPADGQLDLMPIRNDIGMTDTFLDWMLFGPDGSAATSTVNNNISVYVDGGIAHDAGVVANNSVQKAVDLLNTLLVSAGSPYRADYAGTGPPTAGRVPFFFSWDSAHAMSAGIRTYTTLTGGYITAVRTGVSAFSIAQSSLVLAHELGHGVGLYDIPSAGIMTVAPDMATGTWSPAEIKAFRLLTLTKVGTKIPDDSRGLQ